MQKLSDSQVPVMRPLLFKVIDLNMLCWNIYLLVTAVVLGWIFSSRDPLDLKHKLLISILYCLAIGMNSLALHKMDKYWLTRILADLRSEACTLDDKTPGIREMLQDDPGKLFILPGKKLVWLVDLIALPAMLFCVWVLK